MGFSILCAISEKIQTNHHNSVVVVISRGSEEDHIMH